MTAERIGPTWPVPVHSEFGYVGRDRRYHAIGRCSSDEMFTRCGLLLQKWLWFGHITDNHINVEARVAHDGGLKPCRKCYPHGVEVR